MKRAHKIFAAAVFAMALVALAHFFVYIPGRGLDPAVAIPANNAGNSGARENSVVTKVIDGDTAVVRGGDHVRLLGIDADEKGYPCYDAARLRLEELTLGKAVALESDNRDLDQYGRKLRYLFLDGENINRKLVAEGLAVARFYPENQKYKTEITAAEALAMENKTGCEWSGRAQAMDNSGDTGAVDVSYAWEKITTDSAIGPCEAKNHIGEEIIVEGAVAGAYRSAGETVFLDFGGTYPNNCFAAVIFKSDLAEFPDFPEKIYASKTVRVKGVVQEYQGKPEIVINSPSRIEIGVAQ
jgi:micrococcal nuclease